MGKYFIVAPLALSLTLVIGSTPSVGAGEPANLIFVAGEAFGTADSSSRGVNVDIQGESNGLNSSYQLNETLECVSVETKDKGSTDWINANRASFDVSVSPGNKFFAVHYEASTSLDYSVRLRIECDILFTGGAKNWVIAEGQQIVLEDSIPPMDTSEPIVYKISEGQSHQSLAFYHANSEVKCWVARTLNQYQGGMPLGLTLGIWWYVRGGACKSGLQFPPNTPTRLSDWYKFGFKTGAAAFYPSDGKYLLNTPVVVTFMAGRDTVSMLGDVDRRTAVSSYSVSRIPTAVAKATWKATKTEGELSWSKIQDPGAGPLLGYLVSQTQGDKIVSGPWVTGPTQTSTKIPVKPGVGYSFSIRAYSQFGFSEPLLTKYTLPTKPLFTKQPAIITATVSAKPGLEFTSIAEPKAATTITWYLCKKTVIRAITDGNVSTKCVKNKSIAGVPAPLEASSASLYLVGKVSAVNRLGTSSAITEPTPVSSYFSGTVSIAPPAAEGGSFRIDTSEASWANAAPSLAIQWYKCAAEFIADKGKHLPSTCSAIKGATGQFYIPKPTDKGHLVVKVTATSKKYGKTEALTNSFLR